MDFEREVARHKDSVYRQMVRVCGNMDDAEDALAEAIINAYKASDQLKDTASFRSWLASIGSRACIRIKMSGHSDKLTSLEALQEAGMPTPASPAPVADEEAEMRQMHNCIASAIDALPQEYRDVYTMREIEGTSAAETARALKLSVPAVKSRLHRARGMVREALDKSLCGAMGP
ncbi:MAG: RNA polymerase sigma factor [Armatimonadetes bacterium]|nr:RNA polymerase sigma factor [Armatimonadota bacterium]